MSFNAQRRGQNTYSLSAEIRTASSSVAIWSAVTCYRFGCPFGVRKLVYAFKKRRQVAKLEVVLNIQFIDLKSVDCLAHRWRRRSLEPSRRTPLILIGHRHEPMRDRILM